MSFRSLLLVAILFGCATPTHGDSFCDHVQGDLPSECSCVNHGLGFVVDCSVHVLGDEIGVKMDVSPCASVATISLDVTEQKLGIDFPIAALKAGDTKSIDIPGLSVVIRGLKISAGIVLDVSIGGNAENLSLKVGIDACAQLPIIGKACGSKLTSELPIWLLKETYAFSSLCKSAQAPALRATAAISLA